MTVWYTDQYKRCRETRQKILKTNRVTMDYDKIIEHIGETSKWNLINLGLLWLPPTMAGLLVLQNSFSGPAKDD